MYIEHPYKNSILIKYDLSSGSYFRLYLNIFQNINSMYNNIKKSSLWEILKIFSHKNMGGRVGGGN